MWARKRDYRRQHDPKIIANGNLLLFDNVGLRNKSRVLEIDPTTDETLWSYSGTQEDPFLTRACGAAQRLPNGNTLITETNSGRAFGSRNRAKSFGSSTALTELGRKTTSSPRSTRWFGYPSTSRPSGRTTPSRSTEGVTLHRYVRLAGFGP